jgi:enoyl-CoA hydratase/carnithine racemase
MPAWKTLKQWDEIYLERLDDAGVARVVLNRPEKRNSQTAGLALGFAEALEIIRADPELKVVISKGAGPCYSSGLDLNFLREESYRALRDWDRPGPTIALTEALRHFPRITIAQVHGYCLGGSFGLMNIHDLVFAADNAQIGMPEIPRGSFGQIATSTMVHSQIPIKKAALIALTARNVSGVEADRMGLVSLSFPEKDLEAETVKIAREIASRHITPLQHHKIAFQMGRDLSLTDALKLDQLVGARQARGVDPVGHIEGYLSSQKGGPKFDEDKGYKRPDV